MYNFWSFVTFFTFSKCSQSYINVFFLKFTCLFYEFQELLMLIYSAAIITHISPKDALISWVFNITHHAFEGLSNENSFTLLFFRESF